MSDEKKPETALATVPGDPGEGKKSLVRDLAASAGLAPKAYYNAIKEMCGCQNAKDEHFSGLMMVAQSLGLNPILRELYLMPTQRGVQVVVPIDGYLVFLQRAIDAGKVEWHEFEEGWFEDMRQPPEKRAKDPNLLRRGGRVTAKMRGREKPVVHTEWFDEVSRDTSVWKGGQSRQMMHKTYRQFCRYHLGFAVLDVDDAERMNETPKDAQATVSDSAPIAPAIPIASVSVARPGATKFAAPAPLEEEPIEEPKPTLTPEAVAAIEGDDFPDPASPEGKALARQLDREAAGLFDEGAVEVEP